MPEPVELVLCRHDVTGAEVAFLPAAVPGWRERGWVPVDELDDPAATPTAGPTAIEKPKSPRRRRGSE